jgi:hypothetical protein
MTTRPRNLTPCSYATKPSITAILVRPADLASQWVVCALSPTVQ